MSLADPFINEETQIEKAYKPKHTRTHEHTNKNTHTHTHTHHVHHVHHVCVCVCVFMYVCVCVCLCTHTHTHTTHTHTHQCPTRCPACPALNTHLVPPHTLPLGCLPSSRHSRRSSCLLGPPPFHFMLLFVLLHPSAPHFSS